MVARYPERRSLQARWSRRLGLFAVPLAVITTLLHRFGNLDTVAGLALLGLTIAIALVALVLGIGAFAVIWQRGFKGMPQALAGIVCALLVLAWPTWRAAHLVYLPAINDVTTDWFNPPQFHEAPRLRGPDDLSTDYPGQDFAIRQGAAYPEIVPLFLRHSANEVYFAARELVADNGWQEVEAIAPGFEGEGRIEAVARTLVFGFRDDVVIVIERQGPEETRVDMRSASRVGRHDFGENAARIYNFLTDLTRRLDQPVLPDTESGSGQPLG
ncbi:DUF1499 domain-containing protein [Microbaculum marinum]|uniref:DUF1499 domain-containing protein n=1 Tax=Microbaculum marinum TaxID=1764581 RepID=A0AAW9RQF7_9HYPH